MTFNIIAAPNGAMHFDNEIISKNIICTIFEDLGKVFLEDMN